MLSSKIETKNDSPSRGLEEIEEEQRSLDFNAPSKIPIKLRSSREDDGG